MILRTLPDGSPAAILQTDHSRVAGHLAAHWGNDRFDRTKPYESVTRAAIFHDFGWLPYEARPLLNESTGRPYQFFEMPFRPESLEGYQQAIDWITASDSYAGWIVSHHRTGLWQNRYGTLERPAMGYNPAIRQQPEIAEFVDRNEATQSRLARGFDPRELQVNYRLLQVWDHLGLYFTCRPPAEQGIFPVPDGYASGDGEGVEMRLTPLSEREVRFDPYPFDARPLTLPVVYRRLSKTRFASQDEWLEAYFSAPAEVLTYTLS